MAVQGFTYYGDKVGDIWDALYIDEVWHIVGNTDDIIALAEEYREKYDRPLFDHFNLHRLRKCGINWLYYEERINEWRLLPFSMTDAIYKMGAEVHADDNRGI